MLSSFTGPLGLMVSIATPVSPIFCFHRKKQKIYLEHVHFLTKATTYMYNHVQIKLTVKGKLSLSNIFEEFDCMRKCYLLHVLPNISFHSRDSQVLKYAN